MSVQILFGTLSFWYFFSLVSDLGMKPGPAAVDIESVGANQTMVQFLQRVKLLVTIMVWG